MKIHVNHQGNEHFAIEHHCPTCQRGASAACVDLPRNTVHAERVGGIITSAMPIHRTRITAEQNLALKAFKK
jgi:hypothetical protein